MTDCKLVPVAMSNDKMRAEFEAWYENEIEPRLVGGGSLLKTISWNAWQASIAALTAVQGEPVGVIRESDVMGIAPYADIWPWLEPGTKLYTAPQPTPDVSALVEALESAKGLIANHSGEVLPDEYAGDQIEQIDAALAAHRKGAEL